MTVTKTESKRVFIQKGTLVFWTDPSQHDGDEHASGVYVIVEAPTESDYSADELADTQSVLSDAIYTIRNAHDSTAQVLHGEIRIMTEGERRAFYVQQSGSICPYCLSEDITGNSIDIDGSTATQEVGCNMCNATWQDVYQLKTFYPNEAGEFAPTND